MNEKRFALSEYSTAYRYSVIDNIQKGTLKANEIIILLNKMSDEIDEQQVIIIELERKLKKYAKIGEEQLKQITDLQDELNECRARPTDERGVVKVEYR